MKDWSKLTVQTFIVDHPLYELVPNQEGIRKVLDEIVYCAGTIDAYCIYCDRESVFRGDASPLDLDKISTARAMTKGVLDHYAGWVTRNFRCQRNSTHRITIFLLDTKEGLQKVGQLPSVADIQKPGLQKYRPSLGPDRFRELSRAVGLSAHGIGIGAFVYLRRIFESLIEEARVLAASDAGWNSTTFADARMSERINLLKNHLPRFLVDNARLYSIMSKGIHELTEEECLEHFDSVLMAIEIILDQHIAAKEQADKIAKATQRIQEVHKGIADSEAKK